MRFPLSVTMAVVLIAPMHVPPQTQGQPAAPRRYTTSSVTVSKDAALAGLISEVRGQADAFVFLSGGASNLGPEQQEVLLRMF